MSAKTIAFYGAGLLGSGFVTSLRREGHAVRVWNRSFAKAKALESTGARAFDDAAEAARGAEIVHICVRDEAAVDAVLDAAMPGIAKGTPIVDHTTVAVASVVPRADRLQTAGYTFMHAPVFMGPPQAANAQGVMLAAGPKALFALLEPHLMTMTGTVQYLGERADVAAVYKLMGNAMILAVVGGLTDVFDIARAQGLTPAQAYELFSFYNVEGQITGRGKRMAHGEYDASWTLEMADKDARLMQAAVNGEALPVIDAVEKSIRAAIARDLGDRDLGALAQR
jgi:3-hydroxyisobutyrate dehydrogenase